MAARSPQSFVFVVLSALLAVEAQLTSWSPYDLLHSFTHHSDLASRAAIVLPLGWLLVEGLRMAVCGNQALGARSLVPKTQVGSTSCLNSAQLTRMTDECYCGNSFQGGDTGGGTLDENACTMNCAGDATQKCGAGFRLSSYAKQSNTTVAPVLPSGWSYTGCVSEPSSGRTLTNYSLTDPNMTIDECVATCSSKGYHVAGAEFGSGDCGADTPAGESTQHCGGGNRLSIYSTPQTTSPSGPTLPAGWSYVACTQEPTDGGRLLAGYSFSSASLTVESCISTCKSRGFSYAGMEHADECYCGTGYSVPAVKAPETDCSMACAGSASEVCGSGFRLSVYTSDPAGSNSNLVLPPYWGKTSQCIVEASSGRTLSGNSWIDGGMTVEKCVSFCDSTGFNYAGAEFGNECYCDNTISLANGGGVLASSASECNKPCADHTGNSAEICGDGFRLTMYTKGNATAAALPAGWSPSMCAVDKPVPHPDGPPEHRDGPHARVLHHHVRRARLRLERGGERKRVLLREYPDEQPRWSAGQRVRDAVQRRCVPGLWGRLSDGGLSAGCHGALGPKCMESYCRRYQWVMTHVAVVNNETILVIDRKENNPLLNAHNDPAWGAVWSLLDNKSRALNLETHSFLLCRVIPEKWHSYALGFFVNFGGHPYTDRNGEAAPDGQQGVRLYNACPASGTCDIYENSKRIRMASNRWYPTSTRLPDGSAIIIGGTLYSGWTNSEVMNNPTYEFYPAKNINGYNGLPVPSKFFNDTLPHNTCGLHSSPVNYLVADRYLYISSLPSGKLFVAANDQAMLLDWQTNTETRLPNFPNGQRVVYPLNAAAVMLPLTPENNYTPELLICGGSQISDKTAPEDLDAQHDYGSAQCSRMVLNDAGISAGWQTEWMPEPRLMSEGTLLPDGKVLIINGCRTGTAGYDNLQNRIGHSNADHPTFTPLLYDPSAPVGSRITRDGLPTSNIARMYHSVAGAIMIGGSNPNDDTSTQRYASEYRVEYLYPSYMTKPRPTFSGLPSHIGYNSSSFVLSVTVPAGSQKVYAILMDFGFVTHSVHMDQKLVKLVSVLQGNQLTVTGPPNPNIFSPGPGWIIVMADGVPSVAQQVMVGDGGNPPEDPGATAK
ncbi:glyoxal oxidase N-terminus-domain-containing protein [Mycena olivaceomarginata]|nr:glyoxal oxidase N-terminus-domain-containing protein [Mycena olivaceomarginata]